jgi:hypothetical protein
MIKVKKEGIVISKTDHGFENEGVLNPAAILEDGVIHLFYRAVSKGNYSSIGYCKLNSVLEVSFRMEVPLLFPQHPFESQGIEDPRIVKIDELFYLTYTGYDGVNALGALAVSNDLINWEKKGIIVPTFTFDAFRHLAESKGMINEKYLRYNEPRKVHEKQEHHNFLWDKNVIFFPRRINGKLTFLHRVKPDIQLVTVDNLDELSINFWQHYFLHLSDAIVMSPKYEHEVSYIGGGCPPIETEDGWLLIYHGVHDSLNGYVYCACAALLDLHNPLKVIARLPYPLFKPELEWELKGEVNNVCFPTGAVIIEGIINIYYGAADERIGCASVALESLLRELKRFRALV